MLRELFTADGGYGREFAEETEPAGLRGELSLIIEESLARRQGLSKQRQDLESLRRTVGAKRAAWWPPLSVAAAFD